MEQNEQRTIDLLRCALTGQPPEGALSDSALKAVYRIADRHDLVQCVGYALDSAGLLPERGIGDAFRRKQAEAIWRTEQQEYEREQIGAALEEAGIDHVFLKGAAMRRMYSHTWLRTGADVDVLVRRTEQEKAVALLCERLGCTVGLRTPHDAKLCFPSGQNTELHGMLSVAEFAEAAFSDVWETGVAATEKRHEYALTPEMFYVYHVAHMAKHFTQGGCGIRPLMDLWIIKRRINYDKAAVDAFLQKVSLLPFAETAEQLAECWFSGAAAGALAERMGDFILNGGVFGCLEQRVASDRVKTGGRLKNLLARAWLPYQVLAEVYPPLKTHRWRLPYYELRRWCRPLFHGRAGSVMAELRSNRTISKKKIQTVEILLKDLELL